MGQVLELSQALESLKGERGKASKMVFTNGCFDLLHVGHVRYLIEARSLGDILVVGVNTDASVKTIKGPSRPLQNEADRAEILAALAAVDYVILFGEKTPILLIEALEPQIYVKGGDWKREDLPETPVVESYGGKVQLLQFVADRSTTRLIAKSES